MKLLPERIKQARIAAGLTQRELAAQMRKRAPKYHPGLTRIDRTYISAWEHGRISTIRVHDLAAIADATGFPMDWFVGLIKRIGDERQPAEKDDEPDDDE